MQRMKISITGNLSVAITGSQTHRLCLSVLNQQHASYTYCPQTETITVAEDASGLPQLNLQYPGHLQLQELQVRGARVVVESITTQSLTIYVRSADSHVILRNNSLNRLNLRCELRSIVDMTQQALPKLFSHQLGKDAVVRMPNQGPPTCVVCFENEITQLFVACGHWCLCSACSSMNCCPICRKESNQLRVYQQSAVHHC